MTPAVWAALFGGAAAGAVLTAVNSLLTGWQSRRHERRRWLLDKRLESYAAFATGMTSWMSAYKADAPAETIEPVLGELTAALIQIRLVAPYETAQQVHRLHDALIEAATELDRLQAEPAMDHSAIRATQKQLNAAYSKVMDQQRIDVQGRSMAFWRSPPQASEVE